MTRLIASRGNHEGVTLRKSGNNVWEVSARSSYGPWNRPVKPDQLLRRCQSGAFNNVRIRDAQHLVEAVGFTLKTIEGDHHIYEHAFVPEQVNLQAIAGEVKPYQLRQILRLIGKYNLSIGKTK